MAMKPFLPVISALIIMVPVTAYTGSLQVSPSQDVYSYGDFLSFTVTVPEATEDVATFRIIDEAGMGSSVITMAITGESTALTAPNPFLADQFGVGTYVIEVEYGDEVASASFKLIDSGRTVIPFWIKDVAGLWAEGIISDSGFFRNLVDNGVVTVDRTLSDETDVTVPSWYKANAELWKNGDITDGEFANALQYLVKINAIKIGA